MKLRELFRFELSQHARRASSWVYFLVLLALTFQIGSEAYVSKARSGGMFFNAPFIIAEVTILAAIAGVVMTSALTGLAAARDVQTRMSPLVYTAPVSRAEYLGGRFLAAFALTALMLLAIPAGLLTALLLPGLERELVGPFQLASYAVPWLLIALPNAFVATALLFCAAALTGRAMAAMLCAAAILFASLLSWQLLAARMGWWELASFVDPMALTVFAEMARTWSPEDKMGRSLALHGSLLMNRVVWLVIATAVLAFTHSRFRFAHRTARAGWRRNGVGRESSTGRECTGTPEVVAAAPKVGRDFGRRTRARQLFAIAHESFLLVVKGRGGLAFAALGAVMVLTSFELLEHLDVPLLPTTGGLMALLAPPLTDAGEIIWMIIPLLVVFYAGELVWRERDAALNEIADATPAPGWVTFAGRLLGMFLVLVALQAITLAAGLTVQLALGYYEFEPGVYLAILFGIQLTDYLLFAVLALAVHAIVNQKYVGHLVMIVAYVLMAFGPMFGIEHKLLVYGSDPGWTYSDMRGFGPFLMPWVWFKLYWLAWALLLAVVARLLWVRGTETGLRARLALARRGLSLRSAAAAATAMLLITFFGGFVFYNTNVLNDFRSSEESLEHRAEYERRYGDFEGATQPRVTAALLRVEIDPGRREATVRGTYRLVNRSSQRIDSIHVATGSVVITGSITFDRPAVRVHADDDYRHYIWHLQQPLAPGDSLSLDFEVRHQPRGFSNRAVDASVSVNGTFFTRRGWLPAIGYQAGRELSGAGDRRAHDLPARVDLPSPNDSSARADLAGAEAQMVMVDAIVGTSGDQLAVGPGSLRRSWTESGRSYFHYSTDVPIRDDYAFFSAKYEVARGAWTDSSANRHPEVAIEIVHHPDHSLNVDRMLHAAAASLDYLTARFGPYPHRALRLIEHPGRSVSLHAYPINISYQEGFSLMNPAGDLRGIDFLFAVVAHEVAHQWWGNQLTPALAEGSALLSESLAWYSAFGIVEAAHGPDHAERILDVMRDAYRAPRPRAGVPLLRASGWFDAYRRGPLTVYALREYMGEARINEALRRLLANFPPGTVPLPTSLDLYRELGHAAPDSLRELLGDLLERNTHWDLVTHSASAEPVEGAWRVTLDISARKFVVDSAGRETEVPMNDLVEIRLFPTGSNRGAAAAGHTQKVRVRTGTQRIVITSTARPVSAGIDPRRLLIDVNPDDNMVSVSRGSRAPL